MHGVRGRPRLLLVDDTVAQRDLYEMALGDEFTVFTASRGAEGIAVASHALPDVIVLDVMMPGMDGWETCTRLKCADVTADIPVILLTAIDDLDLTQHATAVGASAVLRKPCSPEALRSSILSALNGRAQDDPRLRA